MLAGKKRKTRQSSYKAKNSAKNGSKAASAGHHNEESKRPLSGIKARRAKHDDTEVEIPNDFIPMFEVFKQFVDDMKDDTPKETCLKGLPKAVPVPAAELETKQVPIVDHHIKEEQKMPVAMSNEPKVPVVANGIEPQNSSIPKQEVLPKIESAIPNNQDLLMQYLNSQSSLGQTTGNSQIGSALPTDQMNPTAQGVTQAGLPSNSQSLMLLQRIIQTTPEIQVLHQQEQMALYQIQQSIKTALAQNLGQEIIARLVMEYQ